MASTWNPSKGLAAIVTATAAAFGLCPSAAADPVANPKGRRILPKSYRACRPWLS